MESNRSAADLLADVRGQAAALDPGRTAQGARTFSQKPKSRCHHVLQTPQVDSRDAATNSYVTWTPIHYVETRLDEQALYAAWVTHHLSVEDGKLRIKLKRVDLINCDAAFGNIQLFM
jgi:hypothetical protein